MRAVGAVPTVDWTQLEPDHCHVSFWKAKVEPRPPNISAELVTLPPMPGEGATMRW